MKAYKECGRGWDKLVDPLIARADKEGVDILQIKEKYGGLRFYVGSASEDFYAAIDAVEEQSYHVCETCGLVGCLRDEGWARTLCDDCEAKHVALLRSTSLM